LAAGDGAHCFTASLPAGAREVQRVRLVLEGVVVPGNRPLKIRVTTATGGREIVLGVVGVEAVSRTDSEARRLASLVLDVTPGVEQWLASDPGARSLAFCATAVDATNRPLHDISWSVESARLAVPSE
jgi:hypothetical protein